MSSKSKVVAGVVLLAWALSASGANGQECHGEEKEKALAAFRAGLQAFGEEDWEEAIRQMTAAGGQGSGCHGVVTWVAHYGRWRYRFEPQVYLGLALAHRAHCRTTCESCSAVRVSSTLGARAAAECNAKWGAHQLRLLPPSVADRSECWQGRCAVLAATNPRAHISPLDCPAVEWFYQLREGGAEAVSAARTGSGYCADVTTPGKLLWEVLRWRGPKGPDERLCEEMAVELVSVAAFCQEDPGG